MGTADELMSFLEVYDERGAGQNSIMPVFFGFPLNLSPLQNRTTPLTPTRKQSHPSVGLAAVPCSKHTHL